MTVSYEWDVELVEVYEDGDTDIHDHFPCANFQECLAQAEEPLGDNEQWRIVLVCDDDKGRSWAYLEDGKLPEYFKDAYLQETRKVPQRFHKETAQHP